MTLLLVGLALFFAPHILRMIAPNLRERGLANMGPRGWRGVYSLVSLVGFVLFVAGYAKFQPVAPDVYVPPSWGIHATSLLVLLALVFIAAAYFPVGRIRATLGHPFLTGIIFWSGGHLLANGDLASVLLFGSFFVYGIWNRIAVAKRGEASPVFATYKGDIGAIAVGVVAFVVIAFWLHVMLFGVSPLP